MSDEATAANQQEQPEVSEETQGTTADSTVEPQETTENNQEGAQPDSFTEFDIESVPEEYRQYVDTYRKSLQADYTRKRQADSQAVRDAEQAQLIVQGLQDPERAPEILSILGFDLEDEELGGGEDEEFGDELDPNQRIDAFEAQIAQQQELAQMQAAESAEEEYLTDQIIELEEANGRPYSDEEVQILTMYASRLHDENGYPDVKAAATLLDGIVANRQQELLKPKTQAPRGVRQGQPASQDYDMSTEKGRLDAAAAAARRAMASSE